MDHINTLELGSAQETSAIVLYKIEIYWMWGFLPVVHDR